MGANGGKWGEMGANGGKWGNVGGKWREMGKVGTHQQIRMGNVGTTSRVWGEWGKMGAKRKQNGGEMGRKSLLFFTVPFAPFFGSAKTIPTVPVVKSHRTHQWQNGEFFRSPALSAPAAGADAWSMALFRGLSGRPTLLSVHRFVRAAS